MKFLKDLADRWKRRLNGEAYQLPREPLVAPTAKADPSEGVPVEQTADGKLWAEIASGTCPHCKDTSGKFFEGPQGGMSVNIQCAHCGWWFNVTPLIGIAQDIGDKGGREKIHNWRPEGQ